MVLETNFTFRVKEYYTHREPILLRLTASSLITPEEFITKIIRNITRDGLMNINKLNITQYCENETEILPFILECQGSLDIHDNTPLSNLFNNIRINLLNNYEEYYQN